MRFRGNSLITTSATRPCFLLSDYVQRAKKGPGFGAHLDDAGNSHHKQQLGLAFFSETNFPLPKKEETSTQKATQAFGGFQPLGQGGIPHPFNRASPRAPRRSCHSPLPLGAASPTRRHCRRTPGGKNYPKLAAGSCLISHPFPQNFPNNKKKHQNISKASFLLCIREMNETLREE